LVDIGATYFQEFWHSTLSDYEPQFWAVILYHQGTYINQSINIRLLTGDIHTVITTEKTNISMSILSYVSFRCI